MKKCISMLLAVFLLLGCFSAGIPQAHAATKPTESRTIGIVFDNSGSMYGAGNSDWCKATYAMEVFASMMNPGDVLLIYPMWPIEVNGQSYDMNNPFKLTDASQASSIRDIYTPKASTTPIESIDAAYNSLQGMSGKKYLVILTDGDVFWQGSSEEFNKSKTVKELDKRIQAYAGPDLTIMYLGTIEKTAMPETPESEYFVKNKATTSAEVLSKLTTMCNMIFGRDTLPDNHKNNTAIDFDISMRKLIVFVQGENVSDLKVNGTSGAVGTMTASTATRYGEKGAGNKSFAVDSSLQGMMVTYENCSAGQYNIEFSGNATSIEVYYEPDADLAFVFTDANGNTVDPNALYEGAYMLSYGLMDAKTGKLCNSDLLTDPTYRGSYFINGEETTFDCNGYSGQTQIELKKDDTFEANLTVRYLGGYTIRKDSSDFGWPTGGITVAPRPVGNLELKISGGQSQYSLQELEEGAPFIAELFYEGNKLSTGDYTLDCVDESASLAAIEKIDKGDHYELKLHYRDAANPQNTGDGDCTVQFKAAYTPQGSNEAQAQASFSYNILNDFSPLQISLFAPDDYIVIADLPQSQPIVATLSLRGAKLTAEEFARVPEPIVNTSGIKYTMTAAPEQSAYIIQLLETEGIGEGDYPIQVKAVYTDSVGQVTEDMDELVITLSALPLWLKWVIGLALLLLLIIIIILILRIRVMPGEKYINENRDDCAMSISGMDVSESCDFSARRNGKSLTVKVTYGGADTFGVTMLVEPYKTSFLSKKHPKRSMYVKPDSVRGISDVTFADVAGIAYKLDESGSLVPDDENQKPFQITNGAEISFRGNVFDAGREQTFSARIPLIFKKR